MNKIKICFFSPSSYELFFKTKEVTHGGAELQLYFLAKEISKNNNLSVHFIVGNYKQKKRLKLGNIELVKGFNFKKKENLFSKLIKAAKLIFILIKLNPDIIITSTANSITGIIYIYKTIFRKKHIHRTAHLIDVDKTWINDNGFSGKIYKKSLEKADLIVTQNLEHRELLKKNHNKNAYVLKNAFPIDAEVGIPEKYILWVGRYDILKRPEKFLRTAEKLPEIDFLMICPPSGSNLQK